MATIASLVVNLTANTAAFSDGMARAGKGAAAAAARIQRAMSAAGRDVFNATRTPVERYGAAIDRLGILLNKGAISQTTYGRAVAQARDEMLEAETAGLRTIGATLGITAAVAGMAAVGTGVKLAADYEAAEVSMTAMLGSADAAKTVLSDLAEFATRTPFEFPELVAATKQLTAFGVTQGEIIPVMGMLGDIAAATNAPIGDLAYVFGTAKAQGRLFARDLMQLSSRGIPIQQQLAKQFGVTTEEIGNMVSAGKIHFSDMQTAMMAMTGEGGRFHNQMAAGSKTLIGVWSNLKDAVGNTLRKVMGAFMEAANVKGILQGVVNVVTNLGKGSYRAAVNVIALAGGFAAGVYVMGKVVTIIGAIVRAYRAMAAAQVISLALSGPKGWLILAGGAAIAAAAVVGVNKAFDGLAQSAVKANDAVAGSAGTALAALNRQIAAQEGMKARQDAIVRALSTPAPVPKTENDEIIGGVLEDLARQREEVGKTADELLQYKLAAGRATDATRAMAMAWSAEIKGKERAAQIREVVDGLREQATTAGMTAQQLELYKLSQLGASAATLQQAASLMAQATAAEKWQEEVKQLGEQGDRIFQETRTPLEQYAARLEELGAALRQGAIDQETYARAVGMAERSLIEQAQQHVKPTDPGKFQNLNTADIDIRGLTDLGQSDPQVMKLEEAIGVLQRIEQNTATGLA